jgi:hypothetical protein
MTAGRLFLRLSLASSLFAGAFVSVRPAPTSAQPPEQLDPPEQDPTNAQPELRPAQPPAGETPPPPQGEAPPQGETPPEQLPPGHPPVGPAEAIGQINQASDQQAAERRELTNDDIHRGLSEPTPAAVANPDPSVPAGTIRVDVVDAAGAPVPNARVELGVMAQDSQRSSESKRADRAGRAAFEGLATGSGQAYRINVLHEGAKFSCTPFRLEGDHGYSVRVTRLETTRDDRNVMQMLSRVILEFHDDRIRVHQQLQLVNLGRDQYVFPEDGKLIELPPGFLAFQSQPMMTDQRLAAVTGEGVYVRGSLPPGRTTLVWMYDLEEQGTEMNLTLPLAYRTYAVRVEVESPPGMVLEVDGLPEPQLTYWEGTRILITEGRREGDAGSNEPIRIHLRGLPGSSVMPWVASGAAFVLMLLALLFVIQKGRGYSKTSLAGRRRERTDELLEEAADLEKMFVASEIGPKYRDRRMSDVRDELAALLRDDAAASVAAKPQPEQRPPRARGPRTLENVLAIVFGNVLTLLPIAWFFGGFLFLLGYNIAKEERAEVAAGRLPAALKTRFFALELISLAFAAFWLIGLWAFGIWAAVTLMTAV